jgi:hypothetical protein
MNSKIFRQYDGPWATKPYPTKGCRVSGAGCGLVACTHIAIEQDRYKDWTPETLRPYMLKYAVAGQGTTWDGITKTLQYLGHKVKYITEATPMKDAFAELNKGNRIGIILFYGGYSKRYKKWYRTPDGTVWTGNGHYMMFGEYKYENNKHWFNMKDSGGRKHDGWYSYEKSMKGCVGQMWIVERINPAKTAVPTVKPATTADGKLVIDGVGGSATVKATQRFFGTTQDGKLSGQSKACSRYYPSLKAVEYGKGGSPCVKNLQKWVGANEDGIIGQITVKLWQKKIGVKEDGVFGIESMKAWQKYLNEHDKAVYPTPKPTPTPSIIDKELSACKVQADWMKNYTYKWVQNPTINSSKKYGTCVTYVACVLQRIGVLKSGQFIWHNGKGKVDGANSKMSVYYYGGTIKGNKSKLKRGDILIVGDKSSVGAGGNSHIMIFNGTWNGSDPYVWDNQSATRIRKGKGGLHTYGGGKKIIAVIRLK